MVIATNNTFQFFLGQEVKAPYRDGSTVKVARGVLEDFDDQFVKVRGKLGTIIINKKNIEKMSRVNERVSF